MNISRNLAKTYRELQHNFTDLMKVSLVDDCVDHWEVNFSYPQTNTTAIIRLKFHLLDRNIAPKAMVVFPSSISYVCFEELGSVSWTKDCDVTTLLLSLHAEYSTRGAAYGPSSKRMTEEESQTQWEFVRNSHKDWEIKDITYELSELALEEIRKEGASELGTSRG